MAKNSKCFTSLLYMSLVVVKIESIPYIDNVCDVTSSTSGSSIEADNTYNIIPNSPVHLSLTANCSLRLIARNVSVDTRFLIFQAHGFRNNLTMSYDLKLRLYNNVNGTDIGLFSFFENGLSKSSVYVINPKNHSVSVLLLLLSYKSSDPIPGGCAMEFPLPTSPFMLALVNSNVIDFEYQLAAEPGLPWQNPSCEKSKLDYEVYHFYAPENDFSESTYFESILKMATLENIHRYGRKVNAPSIDPQTKISFSAYNGISSVCVVIAKSIRSGGRAAYIPAFMYTCDSDPVGQKCYAIESAFAHSSCIAIFIMAILIAFLGHFHLKTSVGVFIVWLVPFAVGSITGIPSETPVQELMYVIMIIGIFGSGIFWIQCIFFSILVIVIWDTFGLGFFFAAVVLGTPFGDLEIFKSDVNFWLIFASCIILAPACLLFMKTMGSTISCAVIGSFSFVLAIDYYIGSSLKYLLVNIMRRMSVKHFNRVILDLPFQTKDLILVVVWAVLAILGIACQFIIARKFSGAQEVRSDDEERAPLLRNSRSYGAVEEFPTNSSEGQGVQNSHWR